MRTKPKKNILKRSWKLWPSATLKSRMLIQKNLNGTWEVLILHGKIGILRLICWSAGWSRTMRWWIRKSSSKNGMKCAKKQRAKSRKITSKRNTQIKSSKRKEKKYKSNAVANSTSSAIKPFSRFFNNLKTNKKVMKERESAHNFIWKKERNILPSPSWTSRRREKKLLKVLFKEVTIFFASKKPVKY